MDRIEDMIQVYSKSTKSTFESIVKNPILLILPIMYSIIRFGASQLSFFFQGGLSFIWGFVYALLLSLVLSSYYYQLNSAVYFNRVNFRGFKKSFFYYSSSIYYVFFIEMLINIFLSAVGSIPWNIYLLIQAAIFIGLNAMPETIYVKGTVQSDSFNYNFKFLKENWYIFLLPTLIYVLVFNFGFNELNLSIMELHYGANLGLAFYNIPMYIVAQLITAVFMVFRGHLFKNLMDSTLRKRKYMGLF
ncbi:MAG: hypothetical protein GXZ08_05750 [Tissierellia bacterium]|nr:hypothetical protein [Tissierellia bacterium]